jgi:hypothetical protein
MEQTLSPKASKGTGWIDGKQDTQKEDENQANMALNLWIRAIGE